MRASANARALYGESVSGSLFPFFLRLDIVLSDTQLLCGGTAVGTYTILTAAHCVPPDDDPYARIDAWVPATDTQVRATKWETHPDFDPHTLRADLALLVSDGPLASPAEVDHRASACPRADAIGYGLDETGSHPDELRRIRLATLSDCSEHWPENVVLGDICAIGDSVDRGVFKDTCSGDSGGPLLCDRSVIGIVSRGSAPCGKGPGIYTSLARWGDWLTARLTPAPLAAGWTYQEPNVVWPAGTSLTVLKYQEYSDWMNCNSKRAVVIFGPLEGPATVSLNSGFYSSAESCNGTRLYVPTVSAGVSSAATAWALALIIARALRLF